MNFKRFSIGVAWLLAACSGGAGGPEADDLEPGDDDGVTAPEDDPEDPALDDIEPGGVGPGGPEVPFVSRGEACDLNDIAPAPVRRLSNVEYQRTVQDLFPGIQLPDFDLPENVAIHGFENYAAQLNPSAILIERYFNFGTEIAHQAALARESFLSCDPSEGEAECGEQFVTEFGARAFRRPLEDDELERYQKLFQQKLDAVSFNGALELTIAAFLNSPQFLYRLEFGTEDAGEQVPLTSHELATRLSYTLWQSMPDETLLAAAAAGELSSPEQLEAQARRMLDDPRAAEAFVDFHRQWLEFERIREEPKDATLYPEWTNTAAQSAIDEAKNFVRHVYTQQDAQLPALLTSTAAVVDEQMAAIYGVDVSDMTAGDYGYEVELEGSERAGILTRASFVAGHAHNIPSPPLRGVAVMRQMLCAPPPAPPPNVDTSAPENDAEAPKTNRELFERKLEASTACPACHTAIDGIGYTFEHYDAVGRFMSEDPNGLEIDASGALFNTDVDQEVDNALELSEALAESKQVQYCVATNVYRHAFGRDELESDWCKTDVVNRALEDNDGNMREALIAIVGSHEFRHKRVGAAGGDK